MARLAPELAALPDQHRLIWTDARVRRDAIAAILTASERNSPELQRHVARVDEAVSAALDAMGLPRGPVAGVEIHEVIALWSGRKLPDCRLLLNGSALRHMLHREGNSDDVLRTWVHESLHARQPFHPGAASDALLHEGYEEGLVEGLARYVVRDMAGLRPLERSYGFYVVAYEALAGLLGTQPVALWHDLWGHPAGQVRARFVETIDHASQQTTGRPLSLEHRGRLRAIADRLFATGRGDDTMRRDAMLALWRTALP